jgi:fumarate reductase flavoprotein subunit
VYKNADNNPYSDIVIVGGGGAGLVAALTAAEQGIKNIVVLEARNTPGGNSFFAEGLFALNDRLKKPADVQSLKDRLFQNTISYTHHRSVPRLVRLLIDESSKTLVWLQEKGFRFEWRNISHNSEIPLYASDIKAKTKTGEYIIKVIARECQDRGVKILCNTRAKKLLTNGSGNINGILAESDGKVVRFSTKGIILAAGGFAGNKTLLRKYVPLFSNDIHLGGVPNNGDGMLMAAEIGADTDDIIAIEMEGPAFIWSRKLPVTFTGHSSTVWINRNGERFTEEVFEPFLCANNLNRQPGKVSYTLLDEYIKNFIIKEESVNIEKPVTEQKPTQGTKLDKLLKAHAAKGRIKNAGSWDEIAKWIGVPTQTLESTIKEYNSFCKKGRDDFFNKDPAYLIPLRHPPFYAIRCYPNLLVTHGGIKINLKMEVIDKNGSPIRGLYAAGIDTGGIDADTYNFGLPGHSFSFALSSGRIAGKEAANYVSNKQTIA